jgi:hypothetical protein
MDNIRSELESCFPGQDTIMKIWNLPWKMQLKVLVLLWRWWSARNKANRGEKMPRPLEMCSITNYYLMEFEKLSNQEKLGKVVSVPRWKALPD